MTRRVIACRLEKHRDRLEELQFLHTSDDTQDWRISTRVNSLNLSYDQFLANLNQLIDSELAKDKKPA